MLPLSALGLVAGHGIGILHLQRVVVGIVANLHHAVVLHGDVGIVVAHALEEGLALLSGERGRVGPERVEDHCACEFDIVVVGQDDAHVGKPQAVETPEVAHAPDSCPVAIGQEVERNLLLLGPEIVVSHHHEHVARTKFLLTSEHRVAYALVVDIGPFVRPGEHDGLVGAHVAVAAVERLDELVAGHHADIGEAGEPHLGQKSLAVAAYHPPHHRGVVEDARRLSLTEHLVELAIEHLQAVSGQDVGQEGRRLLLAHRRELCRIANEEHAAVLSGIDIPDQVVEQTPAAKTDLALTLVGYHRSLVDDEEGVAVEVVAQQETRHAAREGLLAVDAPVDGERGVAAVEGEHLGRPSRGGEQHHLLSEGRHRTDEGPCQRCLARAGRPFHHHHGVDAAIEKELGERGDGILLLVGGLHPQGFPHPV